MTGQLALQHGEAREWRGGTSMIQWQVGVVCTQNLLLFLHGTDAEREPEAIVGDPAAWSGAAGSPTMASSSLSASVPCRGGEAEPQRGLQPARAGQPRSHSGP